MMSFTTYTFIMPTTAPSSWHNKSVYSRKLSPLDNTAYTGTHLTKTHGLHSKNAVTFSQSSVPIVLIYATHNVIELHGMEISHGVPFSICCVKKHWDNCVFISHGSVNMTAIDKVTTVSNYNEYTVRWNVHGDTTSNNLHMHTVMQCFVPTS